MKYKIEITNKDFMPEGFLRVQVIFSGIEDPSHKVYDHFDIRDGQDVDWLKKTIKRRMNELERLDDFIETINLGEHIDDTTIMAEPTVDELDPKENYKKDFRRFEKLVDLLRKDIITKDNEEFVALKTKLKDNLQLDYLDEI